MKTFYFPPSEYKSILRGEQTGSLRLHEKGYHDLKAGQCFEAQFGDSDKLILETTEETVVLPFYDLDPEDAWESGYPTLEDAFSTLKNENYPDLQLASEMAFLEFKVKSDR